MRLDRPFVVQVRDLPARRTFSIPADFVTSALKGLPMREALSERPAEGGQAELDFSVDGENVFVHGTFNGNAYVACSRCLAPAKLQIDDALRVTFMPEAKLPNQEEPASEDEDEAASLDTDDLDLFGYDGEQVDLEPLFLEQFVLSVPYAPLCQETCKGLCAQCGTDLNFGTCTCEPIIDPRLSALKSLKLSS